MKGEAGEDREPGQGAMTGKLPLQVIRRGQTRPDLCFKDLCTVFGAVQRMNWKGYGKNGH